MEQLSFNQNLTYNAAAIASPTKAVSRQSARYSALNGARTGAVAFTAGRDARPDYADVARPSSVEKPEGNVTEIILPEAQVENMQLLLPMLTQLNQERRWLAWIDPPQALMQKWQQMHGIIASELLVLRSTGQHDALSLAERALAAGTCHAVVMWTADALGAAAFDRLQTASAKGDSHGVVLRQR
ncbi:hypothetical protein RE428_30050 [Marinobacter nanhaiticus D15-8W]|uniref:LexA family transcriptional regulator n=1 Tax=Marinobacter nanhaiticus D15-8W TaxID=626887 RepID=N6X0Q2_9GAMM|nr:SulA-like leucine-rich domain-containing protein [Marinobacter nanhaiticus]ENO17017.1 LexA family transcriptional regulator [Marinobacter nanhaiticus D15-8W]BES71987.1 hypothetical protein RE428_30050 [Marinobacter nanhaiticus D15-8W]